MDLFAPGDCLTLDSSSAIRDDTKPENVEAMVNTVLVYGRR
jgi:hypothetical protein